MGRRRALPAPVVEPADAHAIIREIVAIKREWKTVRGFDSPLDLYERERVVMVQAERWLLEAEEAPDAHTA